MVNLLQVVIPAVLAVLVAYQGALSRTGRLRKNVKADVELLAALPAEHPSREQLEDHVGELLDELIRREQRQYNPAPAGGWGAGLRVIVAASLIAWCGVIVAVLGATTQVDTRLLTPWDAGVTAAVYAVLAILSAGLAARLWRRNRAALRAAERAAAAFRTARGGRSGGPAGPTTPDPSEGA